MEIGTLVKVTVDHPCGATTPTFGQIGVIVAIEYYPMETIYIVHTRDFRGLKEGYSYHDDEIKEITEEEARRELYEILTEGR